MAVVYYQQAQIFNGRVLLKGYSLAVEDGRTLALVPDELVDKNAQVVRLSGGILTPGYVELQANGGGGVLFNERPTLAGIEAILAAHRQFGTVAMLPTFITDSAEQLALAMAAVAQGLEAQTVGLIGGHFEGPFINVEKKGTHRADFIRMPEAVDWQMFARRDLGNSLVTLAPEKVPEGFVAHLVSLGFRVNAGHTLADERAMLAAFHEGLGGVTHLYNAMPAFAGRSSGVLAAAVRLGLNCGIIVDGVHSEAAALQLAFKLLGKDYLSLVTDSMHTIGAKGIESFELTGQRVFVQGDRLVNEEGALAGAHITMEQSVKNARDLMQVGVADALTMAITTPARYIGRADLARITGRRLADILYLDEALSLQALPWVELD